MFTPIVVRLMICFVVQYGGGSSVGGVGGVGGAGGKLGSYAPQQPPYDQDSYKTGEHTHTQRANKHTQRANIIHSAETNTHTERNKHTHIINHFIVWHRCIKIVCVTCEIR